MVVNIYHEGKKKDGNQAKDALIDIMERKRREEKLEIEKRWEMLEDCLQLVEEAEAGLSTKGRKKPKKRKESGQRKKTRR